MERPTVPPSRLVLLGDPVAHSLSPLFQNAALRAKRLPAIYELCETRADALGATIEQLRREQAAGNVTVPHKEAFAAWCDELSDVATRVGAVNTFWFVRDRLMGDNTDVAGAAAALHELVSQPVEAMRCLVFGAGGSAAAILATLSDQSAATIHLCARNIDRARTVVARLDATATVTERLPDHLDQYDLVINTTPIGLHGDDVPFDVRDLHPNAAVLDVVYRKGGTPLVQQARARGLRADDGLRMLVAQGALSFERWYGVAPDTNVMWQALETAR